MTKIAYEDFKTMMSYDITQKLDPCIEIEFSVDMYKDYQNSWLGKMLDKDTQQSIYWFGLVADGSQAYDYESLEQFVNAKVFCGKSLQEIWDSVSIVGIDACDVEVGLPFYLETKK